MVFPGIGKELERLPSEGIFRLKHHVIRRKLSSRSQLRKGKNRGNKRHNRGVQLFSHQLNI